MLFSRSEACEILGVSPFAGKDVIKSAYKNLVKIYHPDTGASADVEKYCRIVEAYEALSCMPESSHKPRIIGKATTNTPTRREYEAYKKRYEKQKAQHKQDFERSVEEYSARQKKQEEEYNKAMDAIHTVMMVEAIKKLIHEPEEKNKKD